MSGRRRSLSASAAGRPGLLLAGDAIVAEAGGALGLEVAEDCDAEGALGAGDGEGAFAGAVCCDAVLVEGAYMVEKVHGQVGVK